MSRTTALLSLVVASCLLAGCSGTEGSAPAPSESGISTSSPSASATSSASPSSTSGAPTATSAAPSATQDTLTAPAAPLDPAQANLAALQATDWNAVPLYDLGNAAGGYASLNDLRAGGAAIELLGVSYNIVNGAARALVVHTDSRQGEDPVAVMQLLTFDGGLKQLAVGTMDEYVPADFNDVAFLTHAAFEESTEGVVVYVNFQRAGAQTPYTRLRARIVDGSEAGVSTGWLDLNLDAETVREGQQLGATELPPTQNVVVWSPYADDIRQPLPPLQ